MTSTFRVPNGDFTGSTRIPASLAAGRWPALGSERHRHNVWPLRRPWILPLTQALPSLPPVHPTQASPVRRLRSTPIPAAYVGSPRTSHGTSPHYTEIFDCQYGFDK